MGSGNSRRSRCLKRVCAEHRGGINWLSLSPDGNYLLTCSEDGSARLWDSADQQCRVLFQGHDSYITHCHLENDAAYTCSADRTVRKWDVGTGQCAHVFRGHTSIVNRVLLARGRLFSGSYDRSARCWSPDSGGQLQEFWGHRNSVLALAHFSARDPLSEGWHSGEDILVTGSADCTVKLWLVSDGHCCRTFRGHQGAVLCLALDVSGGTLFSGSWDHTVRCWNLSTGQQMRVLQDHQGSVICLEVVNRYLYSGSADRTARCWAVPSGECVRTYKPHGHTVSTLRCLRGILFTGSGDSCARAFDARSGALKRVFRGHRFIINHLQVSDQMLFTVSHDGTLRSWDVHGLYKGLQGEDGKRRRKHFWTGVSRTRQNRVGCARPSDGVSTEPDSRDSRESGEEMVELD